MNFQKFILKTPAKTGIFFALLLIYSFQNSFEIIVDRCQGFARLWIANLFAAFAIAAFFPLAKIQRVRRCRHF